MVMNVRSILVRALREDVILRIHVGAVVIGVVLVAAYPSLPNFVILGIVSAAAAGKIFHILRNSNNIPPVASEPEGGVAGDREIRGSE